jgi:hypothetical protein
MVKRLKKVIPATKGQKKPIVVDAAWPEKKAAPTQELLDPTLAKQTFASEQQALQFFTESIASKVEGDPGQQADMQQFLQLLLETDPILREELLGGLNVKK